MEALPGRLERLPAGREDLRAELAAGDRERIITAMAELVAKRGYRNTTIELVQKRADVSRAVFRAHFESREQCYLACFEAGASGARERIEAATAGESSWPDAVRAGLDAMLAYTAEEHTFARVCLLEPATVGDAGTEALQAALSEAVAAFRCGRACVEDPSRLPDSLEASIVGALLGMLRRRLERGESEQIPELAATMLQFSLTPYLGAEKAGALVAASRT